LEHGAAEAKMTDSARTGAQTSDAGQPRTVVVRALAGEKQLAVFAQAADDPTAKQKGQLRAFDAVLRGSNDVAARISAVTSRAKPGCR